MVRHSLSVGEKACLACVLEATARKPGNVHPWAPQPEMDYSDFVLSAHAIAEPMERAADRGVGGTVLAAVRATRAVTEVNTNLGIVLLFAPMAVAAGAGKLRPHLDHVLEATTIEDARAVYEAIRLAEPGGLGKVPEEDVSGRPGRPLRDIMRLAAHRDLIAAQYANGFREVQQAASWLAETSRLPEVDWEAAILTAYTRVLAAWPDTLLRRKFGDEVARAVQTRAAELVRQKQTFAWEDLRSLDTFLRSHLPPLNPGTSADLIAAALFWILLEDADTIHRLLRRRG